MGRLIVRLKAIEYKEDSFCYLSSQAIHQIVPSGRMPPGRTQFTIRPYPQAVCHQVAPSDPSLHLASSPHPNIALLHYQKSRIPDTSKKPNRAFSSLSPLPVASDGECPRATSDATNFSRRGVKQTPGSSALLRLACRAAWPRYGSSQAPVHKAPSQAGFVSQAFFNLQDNEAIRISLDPNKERLTSRNRNCSWKTAGSTSGCALHQCGVS